MFVPFTIATSAVSIPNHTQEEQKNKSTKSKDLIVPSILESENKDTQDSKPFVKLQHKQKLVKNEASPGTFNSTGYSKNRRMMRKKKNSSNSDDKSDNVRNSSKNLKTPEENSKEK